MAKQRCQALDDNGKQCRKTDTTRYQYFGDRSTMAGIKCDWVVVSLCDDHGVAPPEKRKGGKHG